MKPPETNYNTLISLGALIALAGYLLSGPLAFGVVMLTKPQPEWISPAVFVENYHPIQNLPYFCGFLLIGGMLIIAAGHYLNSNVATPKLKLHLLLALVWTCIFATLIAFNYICQTTFIHNLALYYRPEYDPVISAFSMSNPMSFCWANEMWGYAFLGIATWLMSGYYKNRHRLIQWLLVINGIVSIGSALWTIIDVAWVLTTAGLVAYFLWNVLMIVVMVLIWRDARHA